MIDYKVNITEIEPAAEIQAVGSFNSTTSKFKLEIKIIIKKEIASQMKGAEMVIKFSLNSNSYNIVKSTDNFEKQNNNFSLILENFHNLDKKQIGIIYDCKEANLIDKVTISYRCMVTI